MKHKKNIYFDRKSMGFKLGEKPLTKAQRKRKAAIARQDKQHAKIAEREARRQAKKEAGASFRQLRAEGRKERTAQSKAQDDRELWAELYGKQNPKRVFPGKLTKGEHDALQKLVQARRKNIFPAFLTTDYSLLSAEKSLEGATMAKKRKKRKKSRKGKMPAGLRKYWAKKRRAKAKRRNPLKRRKRRAVWRVRTDGYFLPSIVRYRRKPRKVRRRRTRRARKSNPPQRIKIKAPAGLGPKGFRKYVAMARRAYPGATIRVGKA